MPNIKRPKKPFRKQEERVADSSNAHRTTDNLRRQAMELVPALLKEKKDVSPHEWQMAEEAVHEEMMEQAAQLPGDDLASNLCQSVIDGVKAKFRLQSPERYALIAMADKLNNYNGTSKNIHDANADDDEGKESLPDVAKRIGQQLLADTVSNTKKRKVHNFVSSPEDMQEISMITEQGDQLLDRIIEDTKTNITIQEQSSSGNVIPFSVDNQRFRQLMLIGQQLLSQTISDTKKQMLKNMMMGVKSAQPVEQLQPIKVMPVISPEPTKK